MQVLHKGREKIHLCVYCNLLDLNNGYRLMGVLLLYEAIQQQDDMHDHIVL